MVNLLDLELRELDPDADLSKFDGVALVDHSRPGVNDQLSEDTPVDVVIDHHPPRGPVHAEFIDLRSNVGATSTLLTEYFGQFGTDLDETVATALLYGIRIDTKDFSREVSQTDFEAASTLIPRADVEVLERVESPSVSGDTLETVARAIRNREQRGSILTSCVGQLTDRDSLAQAADKLLDMDGVSTTVVFGILDDVMYMSARSRGSELDLGETVRLAFDQIGSAGGHTDMAGAQVPIGMLGAVDDETTESVEEVVEDVVRERFLDALRERPYDLPVEYAAAESEFPELSGKSSKPLPSDDSEEGQ